MYTLSSALNCHKLPGEGVRVEGTGSEEGWNREREGSLIESGIVRENDTCVCVFRERKEGRKEERKKERKKK